MSTRNKSSLEKLNEIFARIEIFLIFLRHPREGGDPAVDFIEVF